jgi:hypothetical protein
MRRRRRNKHSIHKSISPFMDGIPTEHPVVQIRKKIVFHILI